MRISKCGLRVAFVGLLVVLTEGFSIQQPTNPRKEILSTHHSNHRRHATVCTLHTRKVHNKRAYDDDGDDDDDDDDDSIISRGGESNGLSRSSFLKSMLAMPLVASSTSVSSAATTTTSTTAATIATRNSANLIAATKATSSTASAAAASTTTTTPTAWEDSISGFVAGAALAAAKTAVKYPLDTATVRLQMPGTTYSVTNLPELLDGCFRGITTPLLFNIPAGAVFFAVKDATKTGLKQQPGLEAWQRTCLAVAAAQIPYWLVRNPSEIIKTRQQANLPGYTNVTALAAWQQVGIDASSSSYSSTTNSDFASAVPAYYTGYWENILYAYPADVIKFLVYESFTGSTERLSPAQGALAGAYATAVAQFVTTPLDVVRNRVMARSSSSSSSSRESNGELPPQPPPPPNLSYLKTLVEIGRTEGISGLLAGATPRVGKAMLSGAIQFATYEETKQDLANFFARQSR